MLKRTDHERQLAWACFGLTAILAILVKVNATVIQQFDNLSFQAVAKLDGVTMTTVFKLITTVASPAVTLAVALLFGIVLYVTHHRTLGILAITTMFGGDAAALVVKFLVQRNRPTQQLMPDTGYSFPSGHVFGTTLLVTILLAIGLPFIRSHAVQVGLIVLGIVWILIVLISRVYLRDHFASDTAGSLALASGCWQQGRAWFWSWQPRAHAILNRQND
ncbi:PAP2 family protein [Lactiplantibacillus garii]|uniref:PAP2 family protein n=1 Tax=Lactiplantibacillus garii TaxID=2306423 RepID=A0A426D7C3_9LACO|nr:phosphatase PAP2 family protein [Lactiplantibacillus garii]RRK10490.1 PAP2 family protein [Lactiplantibacillus garii]